MKNYKSYMDRVTVSEELHEKLLDLEEPKKASRRPAWRRYGALAACAALLAGVGAFGLSRLVSGQARMTADVVPVQSAAPSTPAIWENLDLWGEVAAIAPVEGDDIEPGMKTIPGFEVRENRAGMDVVSYYVLPWLGYGEQSGGSAASIAVPEDCVRRELTQDDVLALVGGEQARDVLLAWEDMELTGGVFHHADGQVWVLDLWGESDDCAFSLRLSPEVLPPSCMVCPTDHTTEVWGVEVAGRRGGAFGRGADREVWMPESREVEFIANGVGCSACFYGLEGQVEAVETMVSRFVRHAIIEGLNLSAVTADGAVFPDPAPVPSRPAGSNPTAAPSVGPQGASTEPYDPSKR